MRYFWNLPVDIGLEINSAGCRSTPWRRAPFDRRGQVFRSGAAGTTVMRLALYREHVIDPPVTAIFPPHISISSSSPRTHLSSSLAPPSCKSLVRYHRPSRSQSPTGPVNSAAPSTTVGREVNGNGCSVHLIFLTFPSRHHQLRPPSFPLSSSLYFAAQQLAVVCGGKNGRHYVNPPCRKLWLARQVLGDAASGPPSYVANSRQELSLCGEIDLASFTPSTRCHHPSLTNLISQWLLLLRL